MEMEIEIEDLATARCEARSQCLYQCTAPCQRFQEVNKEKQVFDIVIIGAGVVGCNIARELAKYKGLTVCVLEKESDVSQGASKANSGIVHGGYDAKHGTLKAKLARKGNQMFDRLNYELDFGFKRIGSLVLAFTSKEKEKLLELYHNGLMNGVDDLRLVDSSEILQMEPHISIAVTAGLYCPSAGIVSPYEFTFALAENAIANGVDFKLEQRVSAIAPIPPGRFSIECIHALNHTKSEVIAKRVINCAGVFADDIAHLVGDLSFKIHPRKGEYILLKKSQGKLATRVLFQTPTEKWGKGVLVTPTLHGNLLIGPTAEPQESKVDTNTSLQQLGYAAWASRKTTPHIDTRESLTCFSGLRARSSRLDFIIEESRSCKGFINVAGIESPGLTASPAIAIEVIDILKNSMNLQLKRGFEFFGHRRNPYLVSRGKVKDIADKDCICKCEQVQKKEIENSLKTGIFVKCTDSVKWRTRAGMGWCQGRRCAESVKAIIRDTNGLVGRIPKRVPTSKTPKRHDQSILSRL